MAEKAKGPKGSERSVGTGERTDDMGSQVDMAAMVELWRRTNKPTLMERAKDSLVYMIGNIKPTSWMSPSQPVQPMAPPEEQPDGSRTRAFDYQVGQNLQYQPRSSGGPTFQQLRALADVHDITRICIEKRKSQVAAQKWELRMRDDLEPDEVMLKKVRDLMLFPDKIHDFQTWIGMLIEEFLVTDAPCVEPIKTYGKELVRMDLVDGATITPLIDVTGRQPAPPSPAFQQIIKGVVKNDFTAEELVYLPGNPRIWKIYGMSPVEQIIIRINMALRRDAHVMQFYTTGNVPDGLFLMPEGLGLEEVKAFDEWFNSLLAGNTASRRKIKFLPGGKGSQLIETKKIDLKDVFDEWLARITCACFGLPPSPYTSEVNRATAESAQDTAESEGLTPLLNRVANFINYVLTRHGFQDVEFGWKESTTPDVLKQAQADDIKVKNGTKSIDEVRTEQGLEPWGIGPGIMGADGTFKPLPVKANAALIAEQEAKAQEKADQMASQMEASAAARGAAQLAKPEPDAGKALRAVIKKKSVIFKLTPDAVPHEITSKLANIYIDFFAAQAKKMAKVISRAYAKLGKAAGDDADAIIAELDFKGWTFLIKPTQKALAEVGKRTVATSLQQLRVEEVDPGADYNELLDMGSEEAAAYARFRAAQLVGKKYNADGELEDNEGWSISNTTRDKLRSKVSQGIEEGWSADHLQDEILADEAFSADRAQMIARTELAFSHVEGNLTAWRTSGLVQRKRSILGSEHDIPDECNSNAEQGWIGLDDDFDSGDSAPPFHPNCVCDLEAEVVAPGAQSDDSPYEEQE
jgi:hypothetical protein